MGGDSDEGMKEVDPKDGPVITYRVDAEGRRWLTAAYLDPLNAALDAEWMERVARDRDPAPAAGPPKR
jgi:hypothetical protein